MELWLLLLLHSHLVVSVSLPAPHNVSICSFNMAHTVRFLPGAGTPSDTQFTVQIINYRRNSWRSVEGCLNLTAGQVCNLTRAVKGLYSQFKARIQAFTSTQTSNWTMSGWFQPLSDTVLGPPDVSVSGCGNCLILQLKVPATTGFRKDLKSLYRGLALQVQRTRDGAQFHLNFPYSEKSVIMYLQPGVEYCVTVTVTAMLNSNSVTSKPYCAFTSEPPTKSSLYVVVGMLSAFSVMSLLITGLVIYGGHQLKTAIQNLANSSSEGCWRWIVMKTESREAC